jgi:hypothetical protein
MNKSNNIMKDLVTSWGLLEYPEKNKCDIVFKFDEEYLVDIAIRSKDRN